MKLLRLLKLSVTLVLAVCLTLATSSMASAAPRIAADNAPETATSAETQILVDEFNGLQEGQSMTIPDASGEPLTVTKTNGVPVIDTASSASSIVTAPPNHNGGPTVETQGFCHAAAMAAVLTIGAAVFAFMAASGGGIVAGVLLSARAAGQIAAAFTGGAGLEALVAVYIC